MAPLRSHILNQLEGLNTDRMISFWYGARSKKEMFYDDVFKDLEKKNKNFTFHVSMSDPEESDNWTGLKGFVHINLYEHYLKNHDDPAEIEYYLCGPPPMIDSIISMLDDMGVEENMIHYDKF